MDKWKECFVKVDSIHEKQDIDKEKQILMLKAKISNLEQEKDKLSRDLGQTKEESHEKLAQFMDKNSKLKEEVDALKTSRHEWQAATLEEHKADLKQLIHSDQF